MLGSLHVFAALTAVAGHRAFATLQRDIRFGLTDAHIVERPAPMPAHDDPVVESGPPFRVRAAKLLYEAATGGAVGVAFWFGLPRLNETPFAVYVSMLIALGVAGVIVWRRVQTLWKPHAALGLLAAGGMFGLGLVLVDWVGVEENAAFTLGIAVAGVSLYLVTPSDDRWKLWFRAERERFEFLTSVIACLAYLMLTSLALQLLAEKQVLVHSVALAAGAVVAWVRLPERDVPHTALMIVFAASVILAALMVNTSMSYQLVWVAFGLGLWKSGWLRERFGPESASDKGFGHWAIPAIRFNPFTNERRELLTSLTPAECARRIEERTHETIGGPRRSWQHTPEQEAHLPSIEALATSEELSLAKFRRSRTSIWTVSTAKMEPVPGGTLIRARAGMHSGFRIIYFMFAPVALLMLIGAPIAALSDSENAGSMMIGLGAVAPLLVLALFTIPRTFDDESRELLDFLQDALEAEPLGQADGSTQRLRTPHAPEFGSD